MAPLLNNEAHIPGMRFAPSGLRLLITRMFELFGAISIAPYMFMFASACLMLVAFWQGFAEEPHGYGVALG